MYYVSIAATTVVILAIGFFIIGILMTFFKGELTEKGMTCDMQEIFENVLERDRIDTTREISPLKQAEDAIVLDNSNMTIPEQKEWLLNQFKKAANED